MQALLAQQDRAFGYEPKGCGFNSFRVRLISDSQVGKALDFESGNAQVRILFWELLSCI